MTNINIPPIDISVANEAQEQSALILNNAKGMIIANQHDYEKSAEFLKVIKEKYKQLESIRKNITAPLDQAKKAVMDLFRKPTACLEDAEKIVKKAMIIFFNDQEKIRRDQELKLQKEAEKKRQEMLKKAEAAREKGKDIKADEYEEKANNTIAPTLAPRVEQVKGVAAKKIWKYRIIDINAIPREYMIPNDELIGQIVRASKGIIKIDGVETYSDNIISAQGINANRNL